MSWVSIAAVRAVGAKCNIVVRRSAAHPSFLAVLTYELLVDVRAGGAYVVDVGVELAGPVLNLPEQFLAAAAGAAGVVDVDIMIIGVDRLLDEWLVDFYVKSGVSMRARVSVESIWRRVC